MLDSLKHSASAAVRNTVFGFLGVALALVGLGFLTAAMWMALSQAYGETIAGAVIGSLYVTVGVVVFAVAQSRRGSGTSTSAQQSQGPATTPMQGVVLAFMQGLDAAIIAKRRDDHRGI